MNGNKRKKGRLKKIVAGLVVAAIVIVLVAMNLSRGKQDKPITTTKVKIGNVEEKLTETGNIELLRTVEVKSKIAGTIREILVKEGDRVTEGRILCVIDPDPTQILLLFQKRAALDRSRISMEQAKKELERRQELAKTSLISEKELENAGNEYLIAQNSYNLASQELLIMEREIETTGEGTDEHIISSKVRAPYTGYITRRYVEEGDIVTSGISSVVAGTNLFQIGDPSTKIIKANISEVDIGKVGVEAGVRIMLDAYPDTSFAGEILHISPVGLLQQGRNVVTFKTEIAIIDEDPRLRPGMSCDVDVIINKADSVFYLPVESVYDKKEGSKEEGTEKITPVIYVKKNDDTSDDIKTKKKFSFGKKTDPLDGFEEQIVQTGIKSESRIELISASVDTSTAVVMDAEKHFKDMEKRKEEENKKKKKSDTDAKS